MARNSNQLDKCRTLLSELENMVSLIDDVSPLLFSDRSHVDVATVPAIGMTKFATSLAEDISGELEKWRVAQEQDCAKQRADLERRLLDIREHDEKCYKDRKPVRQALQEHLFESASEALDRGETLCQEKRRANREEQAKASNNVFEDDASAGATALCKLRRFLDLQVAPLEAERPKRPEDMVAALDEVVKALERKRLRVPEQKNLVLEQNGNLDADLARELDGVLANHSEEQAELLKRQELFISALKKERQARKAALNDLQILAEDGPQTAKTLEWAGLVPERVNQNEKPQPKNYKGEMKQMLALKGSEQIGQLVQRFRNVHCQSSWPRGVLEFDTCMCQWKLQTFIELLGSAKSWADEIHNHVQTHVEKARALSECTDTGDSLLVEGYIEEKYALVGEACKHAENLIDECRRSELKPIADVRQRTEHVNVRRHSDCKDYIANGICVRETDSLVKVCESARRCIQTSHQHLKPPPLRTDGPGETILQALITAWKDKEVESDGRLQHLEDVVAALPRNLESCSILQNVLKLLDNELGKQIVMMRSIIEPHIGSFAFPILHVPAA